MKVVSVAEMRALEAAAEELGLPGPALMELAGAAFAEAMARGWGPLEGRRIAVLVGPVNNGGDGLVAARHFARMGARPVVLTAARPDGPDAKAELLGDAGVPIVAVPDDWSSWAVGAALAGSHLVVDALLGIGRIRPIGGAMKRLLEAAAGCGAPIVALDVPSGLDADSGACDPATPVCGATITLGGVKRGLLIGEGAARAGRIEPVRIGIPASAERDLRVDVLDEELLHRLIPKRDPLGHKYTFGRVVVVAGSRRYLGAPMLAALGAARAGAGLVTLACPAAAASAAAGRVPEITYLPLPGPETHLTVYALDPLAEGAAGADALVIGPGLGREPETAELLAAAMRDARLRDGPRWVVDADALTLLSRMEGWPDLLPPDAVLTPHAGEMARLLGVEEAPPDRLATALDAAKRWRTNVVLKGPPATVVAAPDGRASVSLRANAALATAGTGDVLAGAIAGLIGQGASPFDAARAGVGIHACAGELARRERGSGGVMAGDVADLLPRAAEHLRARLLESAPEASHPGQQPL